MPLIPGLRSLLRATRDRFIAAEARIAQVIADHARRAHGGGPLEEPTRAEGEMRRTKEWIEQAVRGSQVAIWEFTVKENGELGEAHIIEARDERKVKVPTAYVTANRAAVAAEDRARVFDALYACIRGETSEVQIEYRAIGFADDNLRWRLGRGSLLRGLDGAPKSLVGTSVDITELKHIAEEQRRTKERLELAVLGSKACTWQFELTDGNIRNSRPSYTNVWELLGYQRSDDSGVLSDGLATLFHPGDGERFLSTVQSLLDGTNSEWEDELRVRHKDGSDRRLLARGVAVREAATGRPILFTGISLDITDRTVIENALRESEQRFRGTFENAAVGMVITDVDGRIVEHNEKACSFLGYSRGDLIDRSFTEVMTTGEIPSALESLRKLVSGEMAICTRDRQYQRQDGSTVWAHSTASVVMRDVAGTPARIMMILQDISRRKSLEEQLQKANDRMELGLRSSNLSIFEFDMPDGTLDYNRHTLINFWEPLGYADAPDEYDPAAMTVIPPDDRQRVGGAIEGYLNGSIPKFDLEHRVIHRDGSTQWRLARGAAIRRADGTPTRFIGSHVDITERKALESELLRAKEHLEVAIRSSNLSIWEYDMPDGTLETSRQTLTNGWEQLGYDLRVDAPPVATAAAIHPQDLPRLAAQIAAYLDGKTPTFETEHRVRHKDGTYRWILGRGVATRDAEGRPVRFVGSGVDVTDMKRIEDELQRAREAAESANRAKDEFLANVSHEIRTPMNAILGLTELALDSAQTENQRQLLSTVKSAARNLLGIINDLLDFSKINAGKLTLDQADFALRAALGDTLRALAARAHRKGLELVCHVHRDVPDALAGDAGRLRQILMNLVGNAIKFTPRGEVVIDVTAASASRDGAISLRFTVRDTGIGIAREKHVAIFRAFEQEDASTTRKYGGTGLGLTISAQLAALMGGDITVDSEPGRGSTFSFTARFARASKPAAAGRHALAALEDVRILVVDDNETNRQILVEWLNNWRMRPTAVGDGRATINALARAEDSGVPYALLLLDARMPDVDGVTLAAEIQARFKESANRIVLLSSDDSPILAARSRDAGIQACLLKPVQQSELLETIWAVLNVAPAAESRAGAIPTARAAVVGGESATLRVLVAEDNELNVAVLREVLGQRGHRVRFASDGRAALALATEGEFDLLLLDLHMPELDGFEVVEAIRKRERATGAHLPIIALTARSSSRDRERSLSAGMDDFLSKPIEVDALWSAIDRVVAASPPARRREPRLLDGRAILRVCGGQATILDRLCGAFRESLPDQMNGVRSALGDDDLPRLREGAHKLYGTLAAFSTVAGALALTLEDSATRGDADSCRELVGRLEPMCAELLEDTRSLTIDGLSL